MTLLRRVRSTIEGLVDLPGPGRAVEHVALLCIVLACLAFRLATIADPPLDRTGWKEIDHLMIAESYREHGVAFWYPSVRWPAEEPRWTEMELPLVPYLTAGLQAVFGVNPLASRALTLLSFVLLIFYFHRLVRRELGPWVAIVAAAGMAIVPLYSSFGHWVFSEPPMLLAMVAAVFHAAEWFDRRRVRDAVAGGVALSLAVSLKIESLWLLLPLAFLLWRSGRSGPVPWRGAAAIFCGALVVPILWYAWAAHLEATGVRAFGLFRGHDKFQTLAMISDPRWWYTMTQRFAGLCGGKEGFAVALAGGGVAAWLWWPRSALMVVWAAGAAAYTLLVAEGNLDAPYRQLHMVPPIALAVACGALCLASLCVAPLAREPRTGAGASTSVVVTLAVLIVLLPGLLKPGIVVPGSTPVDAETWRRAQFIRGISGREDRLVAFGEYDPKKGGNDISPVLFYYSGLQGWNVPDADCSVAYVRQLMGRGATLMVVTEVRSLETGEVSFPPCRGNPSGGFREFESLFETVYREDGFMVLDLRRPRL